MSPSALAPRDGTQGGNGKDGKAAGGRRRHQRYRRSTGSRRETGNTGGPREVGVAISVYRRATGPRLHCSARDLYSFWSARGVVLVRGLLETETGKMLKSKYKCTLNLF